MDYMDLGNALFELVGSVLVWLNVVALYHDREVRGVNWLVVLFFASWGVWNLVYYPHLDQWLSFYAGISIMLGNASWVGMLVWLSLTGRIREDV